MKVFSGNASARVLLKEALAGRPFRTTHQCDRAADQMRLHPFPHLHIKLGEVALGDPGIFPVNSIGMREVDICHADVGFPDRRATFHAEPPAGRRDRLLAHDIPRRFVLSNSLK